jgi:hypothetical protein
MAMQTCAALRKFDARSEMAETPIMPPLLDNECQACGKMKSNPGRMPYRPCVDLNRAWRVITQGFGAAKVQKCHVSRQVAGKWVLALRFAIVNQANGELLGIAKPF